MYMNARISPSVAITKHTHRLQIARELNKLGLETDLPKENEDIIFVLEAQRWYRVNVRKGWPDYISILTPHLDNLYPSIFQQVTFHNMTLIVDQSRFVIARANQNHNAALYITPNSPLLNEQLIDSVLKCEGIDHSLNITHVPGRSVNINCSNVPWDLYEEIRHITSDSIMIIPDRPMDLIHWYGLLAQDQHLTIRLSNTNPHYTTMRYMKTCADGGVPLSRMLDDLINDGLEHAL